VHRLLNASREGLGDIDLCPTLSNPLIEYPLESIRKVVLLTRARTLLFKLCRTLVAGKYDLGARAPPARKPLSSRRADQPRCSSAAALFYVWLSIQDRNGLWSAVPVDTLSPKLQTRPPARIAGSIGTEQQGASP
jgi:hypothetical protein